MYTRHLLRLLVFMQRTDVAHDLRHKSFSWRINTHAHTHVYIIYIYIYIYIMTCVWKHARSLTCILHIVHLNVYGARKPGGAHFPTLVRAAAPGCDPYFQAKNPATTPRRRIYYNSQRYKIYCSILICVQCGRVRVCVVLTYTFLVNI